MLVDQLRTLNNVDARIKEEEFDKLDKISDGMTQDSMINMMHKMNNLNDAVRKLTLIIYDQWVSSVLSLKQINILCTLKLHYFLDSIEKLCIIILHKTIKYTLVSMNKIELQTSCCSSVCIVNNN